MRPYHRTKPSARQPWVVTLPVLGLAVIACNGGAMTTETTESTDPTNTSVTLNPTQSSVTEDDPNLLCVPGTVRCNDARDAVSTCTPDGQAWDEEPCGNYQQCFVDECLGPCEFVQDPPSSEGCSFRSNRMRHYQEASPDALIVGNISNDVPATVQLYRVTALADEVAIGEPVVVESGKTHLFELTNPFILGFTQYRTGGTYRVVSDLPVIAYQHSPLDNVATNDSSMLLPDDALGDAYVVASYPPFGDPSYFNIVAIEPQTTVSWTPPVDTAGNGLPVNFVAAGETGTVKMAFPGDTLQVAASAVAGSLGCNEAHAECLDQGGEKATCDAERATCLTEERRRRDVSGTVILSDKPIWVVGATNCAFVPFESGFCDHLQEQMIPLEYWGKEYVGAHSPARLGEKHYWRLFAGEDDVVVATSPPLPGTPITLGRRGDYTDLEVDHGVSVIFKSDKAFLPVQYLAGAQTGPGFGDPAMYQMVPVEQFLDRYAFVTGVNYELNYAQVIHRAGDPPIFIDGVEVTGFYEVGGYEVADWLIDEGAHEAISDQPFGLINIGYTIPNNCLPAIVDPECDSEGHPMCCTACVGKANNPNCSTPGNPVCCAGPYASYAYPGGMRLKRIYNP